MPQAASVNVVPVDFAQFPERFHGQRLASPATGNTSCYVICSRVPPGDHGPMLHVHPADQFYYILTGTMTLQLGTEQFVIGPDTVVFIPQGTPHRNWNASGEPELHLEVIVPAPPESVPLVTPAEPRRVPDAGRLIRHIDAQELEGNEPGGLPVAGRNTGSRHADLRIVRSGPGTDDQIVPAAAADRYHYVRSGVLEVETGSQRLRAGANSLVVLPRGAACRIRNSGPEAAVHIAVTVPQPD